MSREQSTPRLYEYRIKYNAGMECSAFNSYHYYMAENAEQAFMYHLEAMRRHHALAQNLCVERLNPWSERWEDKSEVITTTQTNDDERRQDIRQ